MGVIMSRNLRAFYVYPPHPAPLPSRQGVKREFPDGNYLAPFSNRWTILWREQWPLNAWPNVAFTIMLLGYAVWVAIRQGYSVVGMFKSGADAKVVAVLRLRWQWVRGIFEPQGRS